MKSKSASGKILICISGSVAAIKLPGLIHNLVQKGYTCRVIISKDGLNFVTPMAISSMGADVYLDNNFDTNSYDQVMQHINLGKWADYIIVCPASANVIAKLSHGFANNLLSAAILASNAKKIIVPAMNQLMWKNSITQKNVQMLKEHDFTFWGPASGLQACGDDDIGRMLEIDEIIQKLDNLHNLNAQAFANKHIVITGGGTREMIDPVRYISNHSSGKMAYALAKAAKSQGALVSLISASDLPPPSGIDVIKVTTSEEMLNASIDLAASADIFIGAAAVGDFTVRKYTPQKIKKAENMNLELIPTKDILKTIRDQFSKLFIVGFAAETNNLVDYAKAKLFNKKLNLIVANDVSDNKVFNQDTNKVVIINKDFTQFASDEGNKDDIAGFILKHILEEYEK